MRDPKRECAICGWTGDRGYSVLMTVSCCPLCFHWGCFREYRPTRRGAVSRWLKGLFWRWAETDASRERSRWRENDE